MDKKGRVRTSTMTLAGTSPNLIPGDEDINPLWYCPICRIVYFLPKYNNCRNHVGQVASMDAFTLLPITPTQLKELIYQCKPKS